MSKMRVLTIESTQSTSSRRMLSIIYGSRDFDGYKIDHCFFLQANERSIGSERLYARLNDKIKAFKPQVILIHTGNYFLRHREVFQDVITRIKNAYPKIIWGIQRRSGMDKTTLRLFDDDEKIIELENLFFKINR